MAEIKTYACDLCLSTIQGQRRKHDKKIVYHGVGLRWLSIPNTFAETEDFEVAQQHICSRCWSGLRTLIVDQWEDARDGKPSDEQRRDQV